MSVHWPEGPLQKAELGGHRIDRARGRGRLCLGDQPIEVEDPGVEPHPKADELAQAGGQRLDFGDSREVLGGHANPVLLDLGLIGRDLPGRHRPLQQKP